MQPVKKLSKEEKIEELLNKKAEIVEKLSHLYKNFRGVIHESSDSEMKYTQIKVLEGFIESLNAEIATLENPKTP